MSKLHEYFGKKDDEKVEVKKDEFIPSTVEETVKTDDIPKETEEETKKDSFIDEILKTDPVSISALGAVGDSEESVRNKYFASHEYPYIPNPMEIRPHAPNWYGYGATEQNYDGPIAGIRFKGILDYKGYKYKATDYNKRMEKIMGNLTGSELKRLATTSIMDSKDDIQRYIDILTKLINMGIID